MKTLVSIACGLITLGLSACTTSPQIDESKPVIGMANPASVYCEQVGGQSLIQKTEDGDRGFCKLKDGQLVDEWQYYQHGLSICKPELAQKLIGQKNLTDVQIQALTKAKLVRIVEPGQPMTMDYRVERVTVTINPNTKTVTNAICG